MGPFSVDILVLRAGKSAYNIVVSPDRQKQATIIVGSFLVFGYLTTSVYRHATFVRESKKYLGVWRPVNGGWSTGHKIDIRPDRTYISENVVHNWHLENGLIVLEKLQGEMGDTYLSGDSKSLGEPYFDGLTFVRPNDPMFKQTSMALH